MRYFDAFSFTEKLSFVLFFLNFIFCLTYLSFLTFHLTTSDHTNPLNSGQLKI